MKLFIDQRVQEDEMGLDASHPNYDEWCNGRIIVFEVFTRAIDLDIGAVATDYLGGIAVYDRDDNYLREIKAEQLDSVMTQLRFDILGERAK